MYCITCTNNLLSVAFACPPGRIRMPSRLHSHALLESTDYYRFLSIITVNFITSIPFVAFHFINLFGQPTLNSCNSQSTILENRRVTLDSPVNGRVQRAKAFVPVFSEINAVENLSLSSERKRHTFAIFSGVY